MRQYAIFLFFLCLMITNLSDSRARLRVRGKWNGTGETPVNTGTGEVPGRRGVGCPSARRRTP